MIISKRPICKKTWSRARELGWSDIASKVIAGRMQGSEDDLAPFCEASLRSLPEPARLKDMDKAAQRLCQAIEAGQKIAIVTDYDVDGVTSHAIIARALTHYFDHPKEKVLSFLGDRWRDGYGLRETIVERILESKPDVVVTADCGSSDAREIKLLADQGVDVVITDHHLVPDSGMPQAAFAGINPQQQGCDYPDKTIAGCMVSWLLMSVVRQVLISSGRMPADSAKLSGLLDWVALGTVADAVSFKSPVNRAVVKAGLAVMNQLQRPCWQAMAEQLYARQHFEFEDLAFQIAPRINARGRLHAPDLALNFLLAEDHKEANRLLGVLNRNNQTRRDTERDMVSIAMKDAQDQIQKGVKAIVVYDPSFHMGVQGIVASRLLERFACPVLVLSPGRTEDVLSGSARSVEGVDVRALIAEVNARDDSIMQRFGGHAGAAGLSMLKQNLDLFIDVFHKVASDILGDREHIAALSIDEILQPKDIDRSIAEELEKLKPYGRGFEAPVFTSRLKLASKRLLGKTGEHVRLTFEGASQPFTALWFRADAEVHDWAAGVVVDCAFELQPDATLMLRHARPIKP